VCSERPSSGQDVRGGIASHLTVNLSVMLMRSKRFTYGCLSHGVKSGKSGCSLLYGVDAHSLAASAADWSLPRDNPV